MKKQLIAEAQRMQKLAGIVKEELENNSNEEINEPIDWDWNKARSTSEDDDGVVYKVWGKGKLYNYYGKFELSYSDDGGYNDIKDKNTREKFGQFIYISQWTKDTDEKIGEIDPNEISF
jgi:hypothetical protein